MAAGNRAKRMDSPLEASDLVLKRGRAELGATRPSSALKRCKTSRHAKESASLAPDDDELRTRHLYMLLYTKLFNQLLSDEADAMAANLAHMRELGAAARQLTADTRAALHTQAAARAEATKAIQEEEYGQVFELTASLAERMAANAERKERAAAVQQRLADLQARHGGPRKRREALQARLELAQAARAARQERAAAHAAELVAQGEELDILEGCVGWQLEAVPAGDIAKGALCIRMGPFFRLRLTFTPVPDQMPTAHGCLELTRPEEAPHANEGERAHAAAQARTQVSAAAVPSCGSEVGDDLHIMQFSLGCASTDRLAACLRTLHVQVARITEAAQDARYLRLCFPGWLASILEEEQQLRFTS